MVSWMLITVVLVLTAQRSQGACPHEDPTLLSFSSLHTGLNKSSDVIVSDAVLLDTPLVDVNTITVSGTGKLVFGRGIDITVTVRGIMVKDSASFIIGSKECRHEDGVNIILEGIRSEDRTNIGHAGEKYIAVKDQGNLHIHGKEKLSWTKLTATVDRFESFSQDSTKVKYHHRVSANVGYRESSDGPAVYVIDANLSVVTYDVFDFYNSKKVHKEQTEVDRLQSLINDLDSGLLVGISVQNFFDHDEGTDLTQLLDTIENAAGMNSGELQLRYIEKFDAFSLVFVKGGSVYAQSVDQLISKATTQSLASIDFNGYKVSAFAYVDPDSKSRSYIDFRILDSSVGYPLITVLDDISSWEEGDEVLLTSTDFSPFHGEVKRIKQILSSTSFTLSDELLYRHFGEIENRVDMRAEVALLSRNIKITGSMSRGCPPSNGNCDKIPFDSFGGHVKILHGFGGVHIEGTELMHMGQPTDKGVYPFHFHMCENVTGKVAVLKDNSIHHTFQRAITIHGTYGTSVENPGVVLDGNVAYDVHGHAFFLEDGAEAATILRNNLGANVKKIDNGFFTTDKTNPSVFWITNPKTLMIGNVAAGCQGFGIWYTFPEEPVGPSAGMVYQRGEAFRTPLWDFDNNVAHSNIEGGLNFENIVLDDDGNVDQHLHYVPRENPLDPDSSLVKVQITRLTVYKNTERNVWTRGGMEFMQLSSAESRIGVFMARANTKQQQFLRNSVFIGQSIGNSEVEGYPDAMTPQDLKYALGISFIYGPQYIYDSWFTGFKSASDKTFASGALSFRPKTKFAGSPITAVFALRFGFDDATEGNRVFVGNTPDFHLGFGNSNGNEQSAFRDLDGSVYACNTSDYTGMKQIVKPEKFLLTDNCLCRENWQMCICDDQYGVIKMATRKVWSGTVGDFNDMAQFKRINYANTSDTAYEDHTGTGNTPRALVVLGDKTYYYEFQMGLDFPQGLEFETVGIEKDNDVVMGLCLPEGISQADMDLTARSGYGRVNNGDFVWGNSLQDVRNDYSMATVFLDGRMLYVHFTAPIDPDPYYDLDMCPSGGSCPSFELTLLTQKPYTPCFFPTPEELITDNMLSEAPMKNCLLSKSAPEPNWGTGDIKASQDGGWGYWSKWSDCNAEGKRQRNRVCDSPKPFGDGLDCQGESVQVEECR